MTSNEPLTSGTPEKAIPPPDPLTPSSPMTDKATPPPQRPTSTTVAEPEIENPLRHLSRDELFAKVSVFHDHKHLQDHIDLSLLQRGALVAQDPANFETLDLLDDVEKNALRQERTHRWKHPWPLYYTIILNSIAAAIQGWDQQNENGQTGSNGANLSFPDALGIPDSKGSSCGPVANEGECAKNSWIIGLVNSMPYITICLL
ncbi:hypothetical protein E4U44_000634 [Claviceps purpurea]|nr:hypothetical protein E4U44_000634 [Claviceps purpurea]